jgi:hypothetical protein
LCADQQPAPIAHALIGDCACATPCPVTALMRDGQSIEFTRVSHHSGDYDWRSDIFTSQTVTALFRSTRITALELKNELSSAN